MKLRKLLNDLKKRRLLFLLLPFVCSILAHADRAQEHTLFRHTDTGTQSETTSFVIVTASYNNIEWFERNLSSIFAQAYDNWRLVYIDDCSTDGTVDAVRAYVDACDKSDKVTLIRNAQRHGHMYNQYHAIHAVAPESVIVIVDGDDWLAHNNVLRYLHTIYSAGDAWLTYGQFWYWQKNRLGICRKLPDAVIKNNDIRSYPRWVTSHVRTFYAGLFQRIQLEDLQYKGAFVPMSADVAAMFPMIEMAGEHIRFIEEILYIYNDANQLSFFHDRREEQELLRKELCSRQRYQPLNSL
ncbi:glycosyltransferase [Candidatus Dependentiae bacterium]|nr:glycosyltransferase [Candidatus Dependentiae bacterium]